MSSPVYGNQFSESGLQVRINASSLTPFKTCPRKYQLQVKEGRGKDESHPDLRFGTLVHEGAGIYDINRALGMGHEEALQGAFRFLLRETWDSALGKPGFAGDPLKNRASLLRTMVWYLDNSREDSCETVVLPSGKPAVELGFEFASGVRAPGGEDITFVGTLDRIVRFNGRPYILDRKTSSSGRYLTPENFSPHTQFSLYCLAGRICWGVEADGIILDGIEIGVNGTKFHRTIVPRGEGVLEEWLSEQRWWIERMVECHEKGVYPQNDTVCGMYKGCEFRRICSMEPKNREGREEERKRKDHDH